jgi:hypothetical protein
MSKPLPRADTGGVTMDALFIGITGLFCVLTWGFVRLCAKI